MGIISLEDRKLKDIIKCNCALICVKKIILNEKDEILLAAGENNDYVYLLYSSTPNSSETENQNAQDNNKKNLGEKNK